MVPYRNLSALLVSILLIVSSSSVCAKPLTPHWKRDIGQYIRIGYPGRPESSSINVKKRATTCNGSSDLCNRLYSNVTFAGAHNSYAIANGAGGLASNQNVSLAGQLNAGIRLLQSQAHNSTNQTASGAGIDLCHTSCSIFQGGSLEYYLGQVKSWVDANPTEVVTLLIVNSDGSPPSKFAQAFESTGLVSKMYQPSSGTISRNSWPTLGSMVDSGRTVVGFLSTEADFQSVNYLLDEFSNIWETPFGQTQTPFNCSIDRIGQSVSDSSQLMYLSNQFLDQSLFGGSGSSSSGSSGDALTTPDTDALGTTNSVDTTLSTSYTCASEHNNVNPNFILTDYSTTPSYSFMRGVAQLNGVNYTAPSSSEEGGASGGSSGSSASSLPSHVLGAAVVMLAALFII